MAKAKTKEAKDPKDWTRPDPVKPGAYPVLLGKTVRTDVSGWRLINARVVADGGPARDGARKIAIEKIEGRRVGERITVRRDRVREWLSPGQ